MLKSCIAEATKSVKDFSSVQEQIEKECSLPEESENVIYDIVCEELKRKGIPVTVKTVIEYIIEYRTEIIRIILIKYPKKESKETREKGKESPTSSKEIEVSDFEFEDAQDFEEISPIAKGDLESELGDERLSKGYSETKITETVLRKTVYEKPEAEKVFHHIFAETVVEDEESSPADTKADFSSPKAEDEGQEEQAESPKQKLMYIEIEIEESVSSTSDMSPEAVAPEMDIDKKSKSEEVTLDKDKLDEPIKSDTAQKTTVSETIETKSSQVDTKVTGSSTDLPQESVQVTKHIEKQDIIRDTEEPKEARLEKSVHSESILIKDKMAAKEDITVSSKSQEKSGIEKDQEKIIESSTTTTTTTTTTKIKSGESIASKEKSKTTEEVVSLSTSAFDMPGEGGTKPEDISPESPSSVKSVPSPTPKDIAAISSVGSVSPTQPLTVEVSTKTGVVEGDSSSASKVVTTVAKTEEMSKEAEPSPAPKEVAKPSDKRMEEVQAAMTRDDSKASSSESLSTSVLSGSTADIDFEDLESQMMSTSFTSDYHVHSEGSKVGKEGSTITEIVTKTKSSGTTTTSSTSSEEILESGKHEGKDTIVQQVSEAMGSAKEKLKSEASFGDKSDDSGIVQTITKTTTSYVTTILPEDQREHGSKTEITEPTGEERTIHVEETFTKVSRQSLGEITLPKPSLICSDTHVPGITDDSRKEYLETTKICKEISELAETIPGETITKTTTTVESNTISGQEKIAESQKDGQKEKSETGEKLGNVTEQTFSESPSSKSEIDTSSKTNKEALVDKEVYTEEETLDENFQEQGALEKGQKFTEINQSKIEKLIESEGDEQITEVVENKITTTTVTTGPSIKSDKLPEVTYSSTTGEIDEKKGSSETPSHKSSKITPENLSSIPSEDTSESDASSKTKSTDVDDDSATFKKCIGFSSDATDNILHDTEDSKIKTSFSESTTKTILSEKRGSPTVDDQGSSIDDTKMKESSESVGDRLKTTKQTISSQADTITIYKLDDSSEELDKQTETYASEKQTTIATDSATSKVTTTVGKTEKLVASEETLKEESQKLEKRESATSSTLDSTKLGQRGTFTSSEKADFGVSDKKSSQGTEVTKGEGHKLTETHEKVTTSSSMASSTKDSIRTEKCTTERMEESADTSDDSSAIVHVVEITRRTSKDEEKRVAKDSVSSSAKEAERPRKLESMICGKSQTELKETATDAAKSPDSMSTKEKIAFFKQMTPTSEVEATKLQRTDSASSMKSKISLFEKLTPTSEASDKTADVTEKEAPETSSFKDRVSHFEKITPTSEPKTSKSVSPISESDSPSASSVKGFISSSVSEIKKTFSDKFSSKTSTESEVSETSPGKAEPKTPESAIDATDKTPETLSTKEKIAMFRQITPTSETATKNVSGKSIVAGISTSTKEKASIFERVAPTVEETSFVKSPEQAQKDTCVLTGRSEGSEVSGHRSSSVKEVTQRDSSAASEIEARMETSPQFIKQVMDHEHTSRDSATSGGDSVTRITTTSITRHIISDGDTVSSTEAEIESTEKEFGKTVIHLDERASGRTQGDADSKKREHVPSPSSDGHHEDKTSAEDAEAHFHSTSTKITTTTETEGDGTVTVTKTFVGADGCVHTEVCKTKSTVVSGSGVDETTSTSIDGKTDTNATHKIPSVQRDDGKQLKAHSSTKTTSVTEAVSSEKVIGSKTPHEIKDEKTHGGIQDKEESVSLTAPDHTSSSQITTMDEDGTVTVTKTFVDEDGCVHTEVHKTKSTIVYEVLKDESAEGKSESRANDVTETSSLQRHEAEQSTTDTVASTKLMTEVSSEKVVDSKTHQDTKGGKGVGDIQEDACLKKAERTSALGSSSEKRFEVDESENVAEVESSAKVTITTTTDGNGTMTVTKTFVDDDGCVHTEVHTTKSSLVFEDTKDELPSSIQGHTDTLAKDLTSSSVHKDAIQQSSTDNSMSTSSVTEIRTSEKMLDSKTFQAIKDAGMMASMFDTGQGTKTITESSISQSDGETLAGDGTVTVTRITRTTKPYEEEGSHSGRTRLDSTEISSEESPGRKHSHRTVKKKIIVYHTGPETSSEDVLTDEKIREAIKEAGGKTSSTSFSRIISSGTTEDLETFAGHENVFEVKGESSKEFTEDSSSSLETVQEWEHVDIDPFSLITKPIEETFRRKMLEQSLLEQSQSSSSTSSKELVSESIDEKEQDTILTYYKDSHVATDAQKLVMEKKAVTETKEVSVSSPPSHAEARESSSTSSTSTPSDDSQGRGGRAESKEVKKPFKLEEWDKPMGLPSPPEPMAIDGDSKLLVKENTTKSNKSENDYKDNKDDASTGSRKNSQPGEDSKPSEAIAEKEQEWTAEKESANESQRTPENGTDPVYVDLTYVPHFGDPDYCNVEFFRRIRSRYYVFSGTKPSKEVFNALLQAKKGWDDKDARVTIIPTYETDTLGYWMAVNQEALIANKVDVAPSASRCTINLQDHETSCSAYRLEL